MYIISRSKTATNLENKMIKYSNYRNFSLVKNIQELADISVYAVSTFHFYSPWDDKQSVSNCVLNYAI